jgi:hypothetical protein
MLQPIGTRACGYLELGAEDDSEVCRKVTCPSYPCRGLIKLAFSPQHQGTARGLRARVMSAIAKVSEARKTPEGYKLKR